MKKELTTAPKFTTEQAAEQTGRSARRVREIAEELGLGVLVTPRCRLLSAAEVEIIRNRPDGREKTK